MNETEFEKRRDNYIADKKQLIEYVTMLEKEINWQKESYNKLVDFNCRLNNDVVSLKNNLKICLNSLRYYSHPDHYEEFKTMGGLRQPGVLTEGGRLARKTISEIEGK